MHLSWEQHVMKTIASITAIVAFIATLTTSIPTLADTISFAKLSDKDRALFIMDARKGIRKGVTELAKQLPIQVDRYTTMDAAYIIGTTVIYMESIDLNLWAAEKGSNVETMITPESMSSLRFELGKAIRNYICTKPDIAFMVHADVVSVKYITTDTDSNHLYTIEINDCAEYAIQPLQVNGFTFTK